MIIGHKHGIYKLHNELSSELILRILGNLGRARKSENFLELQTSAQSSLEAHNILDTSRKLLQN